MNNKSHYETLGVSKTATLKEIKKAFRDLSMKTHPDVAKHDQGERFKLISGAYGVLSNVKERGIYDLEVEEANRFGGAGFRRKNQDSGFGGGARPRPGQQGGVHQVLDRIFHPRVVFLTLTLGVAAMFACRSYLNYDEERERIKRHKGGKAMVEAWKNPKTGQWELPAPWDPTYKKLQPPLKFVPRDEVKQQHGQ
jgi:curved DNA-binding protein CbpA